jgi:hypothetical protein
MQDAKAQALALLQSLEDADQESDSQDVSRPNFDEPDEDRMKVRLMCFLSSRPIC